MRLGRKLGNLKTDGTHKIFEQPKDKKDKIVRKVTGNEYEQKNGKDRLRRCRLIWSLFCGVHASPV